MLHRTTDCGDIGEFNSHPQTLRGVTFYATLVQYQAKTQKQRGEPTDGLHADESLLKTIVLPMVLNRASGSSSFHQAHITTQK